MIKVVCGIIKKGSKVFICRRKPNKSMGGYWEFPGGKIKADESPEHALERELIEELAMCVKIGEFIVSVKHSYDTFTIDLLAYTCDYINGPDLLLDHDTYEWVEWNEIEHYKLSQADVKLLEYIHWKKIEEDLI